MYLRPRPDAKAKQVLMLLHFLAWTSFVYMMINGGVILFALIKGIFYQETSGTVYTELNLLPLKQYGYQHYVASASFAAALLFLKAYVLFLLIRVLSKVNLANPFNMELAGTLKKISYVLIGIAIVVFLHNAHATWLFKKMEMGFEHWSAGEYLFIAGLVFVISRIFKRGVELQKENDLTV